MLAVLAACDGVLGLHSAKLADASLPPDAPGCSSSEFRSGMAVPFPDATTLGLHIEVYPSLLRGGLELWFVAVDKASPNGFVISVAERSAPTAAFGAASAASLNNATLRNSDPCFTADELDVIFFSTGGTAWEATRASTADSFGAPFQIGELSNIMLDAGHALSHDGLTFYYVAQIPTANLYAVTRPMRASPFDVAHAQLLASNVQDPAVSPDQLELFYTPFSDPTYSIHRMVRTSTTLAFDASSDLLVEGDGRTPHVSADARVLVYADAAGAMLETATRTCP